MKRGGECHHSTGHFKSQYFPLHCFILKLYHVYWICINLNITTDYNTYVAAQQSSFKALMKNQVTFLQGPTNVKEILCI